MLLSLPRAARGAVSGAAAIVSSVLSSRPATVAAAMAAAATARGEGPAAAAVALHMEAIEAVQPPQSVTAAEAGGSAIASSGHLRAEPNATTVSAPRSRLDLRARDRLCGVLHYGALSVVRARAQWRHFPAFLLSPSLRALAAGGRSLRRSRRPDQAEARQSLPDA